MVSEKKSKIALSPFGIVLALTLFCFLWVIQRLLNEGESLLGSIVLSFEYWEQGFFSLLDFTLQMMMILVFGYAIAIYEPVCNFLKRISSLPTNRTSAVLFVGLITMVSGLLNWGFGLVAGALMARFVSQSMEEKGLDVSPGLLGAAGYLGMAVWHGGLSGSAPLKVAESGHFLESMTGIVEVGETTFSSFNGWVTLGLISVFTITLVVLSWKKNSKKVAVSRSELIMIKPSKVGWLARLVGWVMLLGIAFQVYGKGAFGLGAINLNLINFLLFGITLVLFRGLGQFSKAILEGLKSSVDIFIQFPFYAGILGLVTYSSLLESISQFFLENSTVSTFPLLTFCLASIVNLLVPSGGGQWAVQGPLIMEVAKSMNLDMGKMILVFAYGDQVSNLLQPFWALPLLAITGVSPRELLRYTLILFLAGFLFLGGVIYFFF